jgi:Transcriptional regulator/sugar kinase
LVVRAPFLRWKDVDLGPLVRETTGLPSIVTNDLDALMEAEHWFGDGRDVTSFATITVGVGVGMGLIMHDRLVGGPDSGLGLIGHFPLDPFGPSCPDGHRGCADAMLANESIRAQASQLTGRTMTYDEVLDLAEVGDPAMDQLVARSAHALGVLVAAVANIAQPQRIILTGEGVRIAHVGEGRMRESIQRMRDPLASEPNLCIIDDDPLLWARGAAAVAIQRSVLDLLPEV